MHPVDRPNTRKQNFGTKADTSITLYIYVYNYIMEITVSVFHRFVTVIQYKSPFTMTTKKYCTV